MCRRRGGGRRGRQCPHCWLPGHHLGGWRHRRRRLVALIESASRLWNSAHVPSLSPFLRSSTACVPWSYYTTQAAEMAVTLCYDWRSRKRSKKRSLGTQRVGNGAGGRDGRRSFVWRMAETAP